MATQLNENDAMLLCVQFGDFSEWCGAGELVVFFLLLSLWLT